MRLLPGSLQWRTLLVLVAALVLSQATALWLFDEYVTQPRSARSAAHFVNHLKTISAALATLETDAQREAFIGRVAGQDGIRIATARGEDLRPADDRPYLQGFRERLREAFGPQADLEVRRAEARGGGKPRELWIRLPAAQREFWIVVPRGRVERDTATAFVLWGIVGALIAAVATIFLVWHLNRPLGELARAATRVGKGEHPPPLPERGPTEIRSVARAFNQMNEDLRRSERERATFLAGISHDLRTPLARLRLDVEMLEGKVDASVQDGMVSDLEDMNLIIDQFIDFTRSESSEALQPVNLGELARGCAERAGRLGASIECRLAELPPLQLRPLATQRMVDNLLNNALRHAGGPIELSTKRQGDEVLLAVRDRGPGIPPALVEHLKQPFTRLDEARSGTSGAGLGLAIVNRVAALHGGRLELAPRDGGGLEALVHLPIRT